MRNSLQAKDISKLQTYNTNHLENVPKPIVKYVDLKWSWNEQAVRGGMSKSPPPSDDCYANYSATKHPRGEVILHHPPLDQWCENIDKITLSMLLGNLW